MSIDRQGGYINSLLIPLILAVLVLLGALGFGGWAFSSRQDYKNNVSQKIAKAVADVKVSTQADDAVKYAEEAKNPLKTHASLAAFGSVKVQYPKTWSAYVIESGKGTVPVSDYYSPDVVPDAGDGDSTFALRLEVVDQSYDQVLNGYSSQTQQKKVSVTPYTLPKVPDVIGSRIDGQISQKKQGSLVLLPLRNMTLEIWTEASDFLPDFNNTILPNITFQP